MLAILSNPSFRHLFAAQVVALLGTGLATVALALLAHDLAGNAAGQVLGTALAIKMIAYVGISPIAQALLSGLPRRAVLVALDLWRAGIVLLLPFVSEIWQVYALIFALQAGSAAFTPAFQATIPDILPGEEDYTNALSLSRLAYDLESLVSPMLAALLLGLLPFNALFAGTAAGFLLSALLVVTAILPPAAPRSEAGFGERLTRGTRLYLATPRLRGLLAVNMAVAATGAIVLVNTVVHVQSALGLGERQTALALAAFGAGSMIVALAMPRLLRHVTDRSVMISAAFLLGLLALVASLVATYAGLLAVWFAIGMAWSAALLPSGRLLKRSAEGSDRPAIFAAQFALSHACWLIAYPLAGWMGNAMGLAITSLTLGLIAIASAALASLVWKGEG